MSEISFFLASMMAFFSQHADPKPAYESMPRVDPIQLKIEHYLNCETCRLDTYQDGLLEGGIRKMERLQNQLTDPSMNLPIQRLA